jgi:hypothetical protein
MRNAVAQRRERSAGLVGAIEDEGYGNRRVFGPYRLGEGCEPTDPGIAAGTKRAAQGDRRSACLGSLGGRKRMGEGVDDDRGGSRRESPGGENPSPAAADEGPLSV